MKPRVFIGSSSEGLEVARAMEEHLAADCEVVLWTNNAFPPSRTYIESLEETVGDIEFAVLVVTPDDTRESRSKKIKVPRDNVVFELGLFMGRIGRERTFIVCDPESVTLPSDLSGVNAVDYDPRRRDRDMNRAVSPAATKIQRTVRKERRLYQSLAEHRADEALVDEDALYGAIASWPTFNSSITVSMPNTRWFWPLFLTVLRWRLNKVPVRVFTLPISGNEKHRRQEKSRNNLLTEMGVAIHEVAELAVEGFFLDSEFADDGAAIVLGGSAATLATRYDGRLHSVAAAALRKLLPETDASSPGYIPTLIPQDADQVVKLLAEGVHQYQAPVSLEYSSVATDDLLLIDVFPRVYKDRQIGYLSDEYDKLGKPPFGPLAVKLAAGGTSIVTPPIVEMTADGPVVIEGTTRASYCYQKGIHNFRCIVASGVREGLPGVPKPVQEITLVQRTLTAEEKTQGWDLRKYRRIERSVHPY